MQSVIFWRRFWWQFWLCCDNHSFQVLCENLDVLYSAYNLLFPITITLKPTTNLVQLDLKIAGSDTMSSVNIPRKVFWEWRWYKWAWRYLSVYVGLRYTNDLNDHRIFDTNTLKNYFEQISQKKMLKNRLNKGENLKRWPDCRQILMKGFSILMNWNLKYVFL